MKKTMLALLLAFSLFSCKSKKNNPKVDDIAVTVKLDRFDRDFFTLDTNNLEAGLTALHQKHPGMTSIFLRDVLGLDSALMLTGVRNFIRLSGGLFDTVNTVFKSTAGVEKDFESAFKHIKYYFPAYPLPAVTLIAGPMDAIATSETGPTPDFLRPGLLGISLQFYLGKDFSVYKDPFFIQNVVPTYRSRRFSKEYIIADAMQLIINDMFPDKSGAKPLIEQMVEKGKRWYMMDLLLPTTPDSIKTGYTQLQLEWVNANEGLIWSDVIRSEDLYSLTPSVIQTYIGEAPFTQGFSQEYSPGNMGQWIGWQIVKKFVSKNPNIKPADLMNTPASKILDEAKYKPK